MAPIGGPTGGGQAGFGSGGSFTGPNEAIELIGDHCYAYSGPLGADGTGQTALLFTTGNYYVVGTIQFNAFVNPTTPPSGDEGTCTIIMNGSTILILKADATSTDQDASQQQGIVIPAYTQMQIDIESDGSDTNMKGSVSITGRIYRA